jgi:hypothetical protein
MAASTTRAPSSYAQRGPRGAERDSWPVPASRSNGDSKLPSDSDSDDDHLPSIPEHLYEVLAASEHAVHVGRYERHVTVRGRLEWRVLDQLAAFVRQHYWTVRPIRDITWGPLEVMRDPNGELDDDTCPVFVAMADFDAAGADPRTAPRYLGGATGPVVMAMPDEPPGGTVQIRAGIWADIQFTRRRDGYWSGRTDAGIAVWTWLELLTAAGPDGVRLINPNPQEED